MFKCVYEADMTEQQIYMQRKRGPVGTLLAPSWTERADHNRRFYMGESFFNIQHAVQSRQIDRHAT